MKAKTIYLFSIILLIFSFLLSCEKEVMPTNSSECGEIILSEGNLPSMAAKSTKRSFEEFLTAQGTTSGFLPPVPDFFGWGTQLYGSVYRLYAVDYLGVVRDAILDMGGPDLGTSVTGTVREVALPDGRARLSVNIHVKNGLLWVTDLDFANGGDFASDPLILGYRPAEVVAGQTPALADVNLQFDFTLAYPGAPIPDILLAVYQDIIVPEFELLSTNINVKGRGTLHEVPLHNLDWEEGDAGMLSSSFKFIDHNNPNENSILFKNYGWPNDHLVVKKSGNNGSSLILNKLSEEAR